MSSRCRPSSRTATAPPTSSKLREIPRPTLGDHDVLVRVAAAGVDRGVWHLMTGRPYLTRLAFGLRRPRNPVPGLDLAGVVDTVGDAVTRFAEGDLVFGTGRGTFAQYARAPRTVSPASRRTSR